MNSYYSSLVKRERIDVFSFIFNELALPKFVFLKTFVLYFIISKKKI